MSRSHERFQLYYSIVEVILVGILQSFPDHYVLVGRPNLWFSSRSDHIRVLLLFPCDLEGDNPGCLIVVSVVELISVAGVFTSCLV